MSTDPLTTPLPQLADYITVHDTGGGRREERRTFGSKGKLFDYVFGGNGVFMRAERPGLSACVRVAPCELRGLAPIESTVRFSYPRVPAQYLRAILNLSRSACVGKGRPVEALFHLSWVESEERWRLDMPEQEATSVSVRPVNDSAGSSYERALIEVHSHHQMVARFSRQDDAEEQGFRLYGVVGEIFTVPNLRVRVGCHGNFLEIPAADIFELPYELKDARRYDENEETKGERFADD